MGRMFRYKEERVNPEWSKNGPLCLKDRMGEILGKRPDHEDSCRTLSVLTPSYRHWEGMYSFQAECVWSNLPLRKIILSGLKEDQNGTDWQQPREMPVACSPGWWDRMREMVWTWLIGCQGGSTDDDDTQCPGLGSSLQVGTIWTGEKRRWILSFGTL